MRKQTAPQIRDNREASSRKQSGLIAQDVSAQQSAMSKSVLDNRSHRTQYLVRLAVFQQRVLSSAGIGLRTAAAQYTLRRCLSTP